MTFQQLPKETRDKVRDIFSKDLVKYHMRYLLEVYYKNIAPVSDWKKEMDFAVGCGNCQIRVKRYFNRNLKL